jgi:uncharacterized protein
MKLHLEQADTRYRITGYGAGQVTVNQEVLTRSLVVTPSDLVRDWPPRSCAEIGADHWEPVLALRPEIVIIGSGPRQQFPSGAVLAPLYAAGIGVEVMDTRAACRTFNILVGEGRRVAAALLVSPAR